MSELTIIEQPYKCLTDEELKAQKAEIIADYHRANKPATAEGKKLINEFESRFDMDGNVDHQYVWDRLPISEYQKEEIVRYILTHRQEEQTVEQLSPLVRELPVQCPE